MVQETMQQVKARACAAHGLAPGAVLLWDFFLDSKYVLLEDQLHCTLAELHMQDGQPLLLEQKQVACLNQVHWLVPWYMLCMKPQWTNEIWHTHLPGAR
jgi:hypothetical protein